MLKTKKVLTAVVALAMVFSYAFAFSAALADTSMTTTTTTTTAGAQTYNFQTNLTVGSTGADVVALQTLLVSQGYLTMPSGVSMGYFGSLTKEAVVKWQAAVGLPATGFFGPLSRGKVNGANISTGMTSTGALCPNGMTLASNCTAAPATTSTVALCPNGMTIASNCSALPTSTTTSTGATGITTPGAEGILSITQGPISTSVVNVGQTQAPVLTVRAQAQNSDIAVQRITVDVGSSTTIYNKIYSQFYVTDGTNVLATVPLNSTTVVQSGTDYVVNLTGFNILVPKNTYKDIVIKADLFSSIDSNYIASPYVLSVMSNGVRGIDGAGIDQYGPTGSISQTITINPSLTDNAQANLSADPSTPLTNTQAVTDTTNNQYLGLPVLLFDINAQNDSLHIHNLTVRFTSNATSTLTAAYLYQGSTPIQSASINSSNGTAVFNNIPDNTAAAVVALNSTQPFTVRADVTNVGVTPTTVTATINSGDLVAYNSLDENAIVNGSAVGNTQTVVGKGPQYTLSSTPTIAVNGSNSSGTSLSTSTITATFNVNVKAVGSNVYFNDQTTATPMFTFKVFDAAGNNVSATIDATSSGFIIPNGSGVVTSGQPNHTFYIPQSNSATIGPVTFSFAGKHANNNLTNGPYSVEISGINSSITSPTSGFTLTTYMDGLSTWRTNGVNP